MLSKWNTKSPCLELKFPVKWMTPEHKHLPTEYNVCRKGKLYSRQLCVGLQLIYQFITYRHILELCLSWVGKWSESKRRIYCKLVVSWPQSIRTAAQGPSNPSTTLINGNELCNYYSELNRYIYITVYTTEWRKGDVQKSIKLLKREEWSWRTSNPMDYYVTLVESLGKTAI